MIDFACKTVDLRKVVACSFGLTTADLRVLVALLAQSSWCTSEHIEQKTGLDRSSVQRSLKRLTTQELCSRRQENVARGGYRYHYQAISRAALAERVLQSIDGFRNSVGAAIRSNPELLAPKTKRKNA